MTFDEHDGTYEGRAFPDESDWLESTMPSDEDISRDFVERTITALRGPDPGQLASYRVPEPSTDFVERTMTVLHQDRRERWRELLARYVAPEPSHEFVTRTLRALESDRPAPAPAPLARRPSLLRTWAMPLFAAAAVLAVAFLLPNDEFLTLEVRATESIPVAFGPAHAGSPLPALLTVVDHDADPLALPDTGGDGIWLLMQRSR